MFAMTSSFLSLLLVLLAFQVTASTVFENPNAESPQLVPREISCQEFATIANLSIIGGNSTFRAAFIKSSPQGTLQSENLLTNAQNQFVQLNLINDTALNQTCGNLTAIAIAEAPKNFSKGIIGPFSISGGTRLGSGNGFVTMITAAVVGAAVFAL